MLILLCLVSALLPGSLAQRGNSAIVCNTIINRMDCSHFPTKYICATNGVTYDTECSWAKAHCKDNRLHVKSESPCPTSAPTTKLTTTEKTTTMTTDKTITPTVVMSTSQTTGDKSTDKSTMSTTVTTKGPMNTTVASSSVTPSTPSGASLSPFCQTFVSQTCPSTPAEICANDYKTYLNFCEYQRAKCLDDNLSILHNGACLPGEGQPTTTQEPVDAFEVLCRVIANESCPPDVDEICGSDGKTYQNPCEIEKAKCQDSSLSAISLGPCAS